MCFFLLYMKDYILIVAYKKQVDDYLTLATYWNTLDWNTLHVMVYN